VRISATTPIVVHPAGVLHRAFDRLPNANGPQTRETFAQMLRRANEEADRASSRTDGPVPFAQHLWAINRRDDPNKPVLVRGVPAIAPTLHPAGTLLAARNRGEPVSAPVAAPSVPRLGDVPGSSRVVVHEAILVAYSVRNLLSRGAIIDLTG
jgi:hypothetical protein